MMMPNNFEEKRITRNYDIIATGFSSQQKSEQNSFRLNIEAAKDITALFASTILSSIGYGILIVLIAIKAEEYIKNEILISISSISQVGAGVLFGRLLPIIAHRIGMTNSIHLANLTSAICALLLYFYIDYFLWIFILFCLGSALFAMGVTRQTLLIDLAPKHTKAVIISSGSMLVAIGNAFGPILLETIKTSDGFYSYAIAAAAYLLSTIPLYRLKKSESKVRKEKKIGIWRYIKKSPKIMFAGFCVNYSLSSASAFLVIYGIKSGLPSSEAALLYSSLLFGTLFSIPVGYLTDVVNRRMLMILSTAISLFFISLIYHTDDIEKINFLLFITFGCLIGVKLPAVVLINEKYKPTQRLAVNSAFTKLSLIGNVVGILSTGAIMKIFGPKGLWLSIMTALSCYLIFCTSNYIKKMLSGELMFKKFSFTKKSQME